MKHAIALAVALMLTACGGQPAQARPLNICLQPSDRIVAMKNCDSTIQPLTDTDPVRFVARQMQLPGNVMLWIGRGDWRNQNFRSVISEAQKYPGKVTHVYVADEVNWCGTYVCIGRDDELIRQATEIAHAAGFKTTATITQAVIFAKGFKLPSLDVIGIDPYYVTMDPYLDMGGCKVSTNPILNQWKCSVAKLRSLGFNGPVVYVGQGFGLTTDTPAYRMMYLQMQAEAYAQSDADAVMSWGCYLGAPELAAEPNLVPLCNTPYEALVTP